MRAALGWFVVAVVSLLSLGVGIGIGVMLDADPQVYAGTSVGGIIAGVAVGLWLKDKIVGAPKAGLELEGTVYDPKKRG